MDAMPRKRFTNEQTAFVLRQAENGATEEEDGSRAVANASHMSLTDAVGRLRNLSKTIPPRPPAAMSVKNRQVAARLRS